MKSAEGLPAAVPVYDDMLKRDWSWAMDEGDRHFQQEDAVFKSLRKIAARLDSIGVPSAIAGAMALNIQQLIQAADRSADFANELNPYVREKYPELWHGVKVSPVGPVEPWPD
jgi:hypothetical protein